MDNMWDPDFFMYLPIICQMEAAPAAGSVCPRALFTAQRVNTLPEELSTAVAAPISMGSPRGVPVPCISRVSTASAERLALINASLIACRHRIFFGPY